MRALAFFGATMALLAAAIWVALPLIAGPGDGTGFGTLLGVPARLEAGLRGADSAGASPNALVRWPVAAPIPYLVAGRFSEDDRALVARRLDEIAAATGLRFEDAGDRPFLATVDEVEVKPPPGIGARLASFAFPAAGWDMTDRGVGDAKTSYLLRLVEGPWVIWWEAKLVLVAADDATILAVLRHRSDAPAGTATAFAAGRLRCALDLDHHATRFEIQRALVLVPAGPDPSTRACVDHLLAVAMGGTLDWIAVQTAAEPPRDAAAGRERLACDARARLRTLYDRRVPPGPAGSGVAAAPRDDRDRWGPRRECGRG